MSKMMLKDAPPAVAVAVALLLAYAIISAMGSAAAAADEKIYTQTFRSPGFKMGPGNVAAKYMSVDMPKGNIALKSFNTQVVDEDGTPIPLYETYLHHWTLHRFYVPRSTRGLREPVDASNSGVCGSGQARQFYGLGSETRRTDTNIPAPYGIVIGDSKSVPEGYDETWVLNVHAIDTRGAIDRLGCTECVCELYNITVGSTGKPIPPGYPGGLECCFDDCHCAVRSDYYGSERVLYMEYYVDWVEMSDAVVPVMVYILDVTDVKSEVNEIDVCNIEYTVPKCSGSAASCKQSIHLAENVNFLPTGGDVIYGVAHQHTSGAGSALYNEDGTEICNSLPIYGNGTEPGNEEGYIVGMTTCFPEPGTVKIRAGEKLRLVSRYKNDQQHTGVMDLFYLLIDESQAPPPLQESQASKWIIGVFTILGAFILVGAIVSRHLKMKKKDGPEYEQIRP